jgi:hypothetical protein
VRRRRSRRFRAPDWFGPAGKKEIANAIRGLWSEDAEGRSEAVGTLQERLWHQGTVFEVTAPAVPFVADAALGDVVSRDDRIWLVALLAWIASGSSYHDAHRGFFESRGRRVDEAVIERELGWVRDARVAVRRRLPEFLDRLTAEPDASLQIVLAELAAQFPEDADDALPRVRQLVDAESGETRRLVLELAAAALGAAADRDDLLRRLPRDYYDAEDVDQLRRRFASAADERDVYREILDNVVGIAIDLSEPDSAPKSCR